MEFNFDDTALEKVALEIANAKKFVKIAVFQIHNDQIIEALKTALSNSVTVEILTLPYDSINEDIRESVTRRLVELSKKGAKLYFCKWGIGDPARTTTAVGRWYSFHGKFVVTDKCAISISANLTDEKELDAILIFRDKNKIDEFVSKFNWLLGLFIGTDTKEGEIKNLIMNSGYDQWKSLFEAPKSITDEQIKNHWIKDYPLSILKSDFILKDGLYVAPFDFMGRYAYEKIISEATKFAYISTESFTDEDIVKTLIRAQLKGVDVRILTGGTSQDFQVRLKELYPEVVSSGVKIRIPKTDLHAKLIVTDKLLLIGSINLNKMNLGKKTSKSLWRANTETITISTDSSLTKTAKDAYIRVFDEADNVVNFLAEKEEKATKSIFEVFDKGIKVKSNVRKLFAKLIIDQKVKSKKDMYMIAKYAFLISSKIAKRNTIEIKDFLSAVILNYLTESMKTKSEIAKRIDDLENNINVEDLLHFLLGSNLISKENDFYKINLEKLIG